MRKKKEEEEEEGGRRRRGGVGCGLLDLDPMAEKSEWRLNKFSLICSLDRPRKGHLNHLCAKND